MANILLNINAILNFRRSSKISEKIYTQGVMLKELLFGNFSEEEYVKEKFFNYQNYIMENEKKINYKKGYIIKGLNSILISMILLIIILIIIFVFI